MEYIGEHLWTGRIGNSFVILSFVAALMSAISYFLAHRNPVQSSWRNFARGWFTLHVISVVGVMGSLFYMLYTHQYEYHYVWQHSNNAMPLRYIFSCFWEGQEGSFLLWLLWQAILGVFVMFTAGAKWEFSVMAVIALVQTFLASMLLGIDASALMPGVTALHHLKIGSNPFTMLLREHPDFLNLPLFSKADYLTKLDGRGLNPLLQNYWMTIHPPTLFLGFAATLVPFAYATAGLWTKRFYEWQKPALPWAFFGVMVLGAGILMGGAWAYEALSFGGFWAWDPVENASLVPWLTLVGAAHVMLIYKQKGTSLFATFFLTIVTFILILYSTFLTRSGVLGDSSVHAFTDLGMLEQLVIFLLFFCWLPVWLLLGKKLIRQLYLLAFVITLASLLFSFYTSVVLISFGLVTLALIVWGYQNEFPKEQGEDDLWSREFWMFIGALVLMCSAFQIISTTSIPVINKIFNQNFARPIDAIQHFNKFQVPFAVLIALLAAFTQFLKYKHNDFKTFLKKIVSSFVIALLITAIATYLIYFSGALTSNGVINKGQVGIYVALLFTGVFAVVANLNYWIVVLKGKIRKSGASIAHVGFALILIGALVSTSRKEVISTNTSGKNIESLDKELKNDENILLAKGDTLQMGPYYVTYKGKKRGNETDNFKNIYFEVDYLTKQPNGKLEKVFTLQPLVQTNPRMGNIAEPDTRHFWEKDIYTHVTYATLEDIDQKPASNEYSDPSPFTIKATDTITSSNALIILDSLVTNIPATNGQFQQNDLVVGAHFTLKDIDGNSYEALPYFIIRNGQVLPVEDEVNELGVKLNFWKLNPDKGTIEVALSERKNNQKDFIVMAALIFPYINVLWIGCLVMVVGTVIAVIERIRLLRRTA